jgi:hypothetical protein
VQRILRHVRGNVIGYAALFVALGGTSYAAINLPAKSVGNRELKNNAVTSAKVKNGSLRAVDFRAGDLPAGPKGDTGPQGPQGPKGDPGASAATLWAVVRKKGTLVQGKGVVGVTNPTAGVYYVQFDRFVDKCAMIASLGGYVRGADQAAIPTGTAGAQVESDTSELAASRAVVITRDSAFGSTNLPFHLAVYC